jgi:Domain of unknown function (DUF4279)
VGSHWVKSSVRVTSATATVDEITIALGMEPSRAHERGTLTSPRNPRSQRRERAVWLVKSDVPEEATLADHLRWAVELGERILAHADELPDDWSGDVVIGWTPERDQESIYLDAELLAALARTSFNIALSVYPAGADE